jgi:hypothetical protein
MPQQSNALFQQPSPAPQQPPQYQAFSMSDLGSSSSPSHSPPSQPPPSPQLPSYALSPQGAQCYKQPYHRTSHQQQAGFPSFRLPSSPVAISHSPTPGSEPPNLRQSIASPTVRSPSLRSNSLPGLQDDTFLMPKVSTVTVPVWAACSSQLSCAVGCEPRLCICEVHRCFYALCIKFKGFGFCWVVSLFCTNWKSYDVLLWFCIRFTAVWNLGAVWPFKAKLRILATQCICVSVWKLYLPANPPPPFK